MLPITVNTESGEVRSHVTAGELTALVARLGGEGDHFAVVERAEPAAGTEAGGDHYIQTWREGDGPYEVEYREGTAERHFGVRMDGAGEVVAVFLAWARCEEGWADGHAWEQVRFPADEGEAEEEGEGGDVGLDPELLAEAETLAGLLIRCGFDTAGEITEAVSDHFHVDGGTPLSVPAAGRIVRRLWRERLAEQEGWPEVTDADRVAAAFAALNGSDVTARMHFACCGTCAFAEIGGEAAEGDHGYVFFQYEDTRHAADGGALLLSYGAHAAAGAEPGTGDGETAVAVGREVVAALTSAGLTVRWDGDPDRAIRVEPLDWRRRLPAA
ncbi:DUF6891 domain-containing protein [Streptomyces hiroshimensis]|uniref:DUF6891 domain-containing protein n=1 Tax=Streptomyces hiroshimensis TaxID=66424 RepID=A0ABQ2Y9R7_9ACTN|nr:hypothetical protein [Streptomyces hiroshimensis]GGX72748.1 hypothetical protein GCM10010324_17700 [Streptomyces hiroshimensis]